MALFNQGCMKFQCSKCGACCRRAGLMGIMPQREDGACIHLAEDNTCKIYETRPDICRVETMFERYKPTLKMSKKEYFKFANECCNTMITDDRLDVKYLIPIEENGTDAT